MLVGRETCICYNFTTTWISRDPFSILLPMLFLRPHQCSAKCPLMAIGNFSRSAVMWRFLQALKLRNFPQHFKDQREAICCDTFLLNVDQILLHSWYFDETLEPTGHIFQLGKKVETCPQLARWGYEGPPPGIVVVMTRIPFGEHRDRATVQDDSSRREGSRFRLVAEQVT